MCVCLLLSWLNSVTYRLTFVVRIDIDDISHEFSGQHKGQGRQSKNFDLKHLFVNLKKISQKRFGKKDEPMRSHLFKVAFLFSPLVQMHGGLICIHILEIIISRSYNIEDLR